MDETRSIAQTHDALWPEPVPGEIRPAWAFEKGLVVFGFGPDAPKRVQLEFITPAFQHLELPSPRLLRVHPGRWPRAPRPLSRLAPVPSATAVGRPCAAATTAS